MSLSSAGRGSFYLPISQQMRLCSLNTETPPSRSSPQKHFGTPSMASNSNCSNYSSLEARNGSSMSQSHALDTAPYPSGDSPTQTPHDYYPIEDQENATHTANHYPQSGICIGSENRGHPNSNYTSESQSRTTTSYATSPESTLGYANQPQYGQTYYTSATIYLQESAYASEISIEDDQIEARVVDPEHFDRNFEQNYPTAVEGVQYGQLNVPVTSQQDPLTIRRWSRENAPEERLRVGLPRWENEQHRVAYEQGNSHGNEQDCAVESKRRLRRGRRNERRR